MLQCNLTNCKIRYIDSLLEDVFDKLDDNYDLMYLSNILGRSNNINENIIILKSLATYLNEKGTIYDYTLMNRYSWQMRHNLDIGNMREYFSEFDIEMVKCNGGEVYKYIKK